MTYIDTHSVGQPNSTYYGMERIEKLIVRPAVCVSTAQMWSLLFIMYFYVFIMYYVYYIFIYTKLWWGSALAPPVDEPPLILNSLKFNVVPVFEFCAHQIFQVAEESALATGREGPQPRSPGRIHFVCWFSLIYLLSSTDLATTFISDGK